MKWMADIDIKGPENKINYNHSLFLTGSCFTEHIGNCLADYKFPVLQNPNGILFDPISVCNSLQSYIDPKKYTTGDLFYLNDLWQSWQHHSMFSSMDEQAVLDTINQSQQRAHLFLKKADWMIITLGSSFSYRLHEERTPVANCHRAPAQWFDKHLTGIEEITTRLEETIIKLKDFNPRLQIIFTISPVRHLRDGVVDNNRSKARLIEAVHYMAGKYNHCMYFPAYELVIDVLRDYRFYDVDLAHPNYAATEFVFENFKENYMEPSTLKLMEEVKKMVNAYRHRPFNPLTTPHQNFIKNSLLKARQLQQQLPQLDFSDQIDYFNQSIVEA
ncbi:MAG: GSCFA domain-containing protein [Chitinophagaceae bacterium]|nr:GSCFA domain-containing protein [Chitinophagaceae bacterium]